MKPLLYFDRKAGMVREEKIYGENFLSFLYGGTFIGNFIKNLISKVPFFSYLYGVSQSSSLSKRKVLPFIKKYEIDTGEFLKDPNSFSSFNDFFIRQLKKEARPIAPSQEDFAAPADARYLAFQNIAETDGFLVKGKKFTLSTLLNNPILAKRYEKGSLLLARLCPVDYHRFHFPCDGIASKPFLVNGSLYSVNPIALRQNISIFQENKRKITEIDSQVFGLIQYLEVGATFVGSIHETFQEGPVKKGDEKGYFSFGGSALILLFEPGKILFDEDLLKNTKEGLETLCVMGESMGKAPN